MSHFEFEVFDVSYLCISLKFDFNFIFSYYYFVQA